MRGGESSPLIPDEDDNAADGERNDLQVSIKSNSSNASNMSRSALSGGLDNGTSGTGNLSTLIHLIKGNIGIGTTS